MSRGMWCESLAVREMLNEAIALVRRALVREPRCTEVGEVGRRIDVVEVAGQRGGEEPAGSGCSLDVGSRQAAGKPIEIL